MRSILVMYLLMILIGCSSTPSQNDIQTAIAETQAAWTPTPPPSATPKPTATSTATPSPTAVKVSFPEFDRYADVLAALDFVHVPSLEDNCKPCQVWGSASGVAVIISKEGIGLLVPVGTSDTFMKQVYSAIAAEYGDEVMADISSAYALGSQGFFMDKANGYVYIISPSDDLQSVVISISPLPR